MKLSDLNLKDNWNPNRSDSSSVIRIRDACIQYRVGSRREDLKSIAINLFRREFKKPMLKALNHIHLDVSAGEIVGILGRNGAGKTTLCKLISGLLKPDEGEVMVQGAVTALLSLGTGFDPMLSGRENIFLNGMMLGFSKADLQKKIFDICMFSELGEFIDQPVKYYSSGMKSRLGFSIASMIEPDVLILDEILNTGDIHFSQKAIGKIDELILHSKIVFLVTHQPDLVANYCTRALWLDQGRIVEDGIPGEVVNSYKNYISRIPAKPLKNMENQKSSDNSNAWYSAKKGKIVVSLKKASIGYRLWTKDGLTVFSKQKKIHWGLRDVSLDVREGEVLGVIGPNGAGKTTLCRLIGGLIKTDAGHAVVTGKVNALLTLGTGFDMELSGRENIILSGMTLGFPRKRIYELYDDIVRFSELENFIHSPVKTYSNGMKARLGFSVISMLKPDIFMIDEALSAGDAAFHKKSSARIHELISEAKSTIIVSHNLNFVETVCSRAIWLDKGEIMMDGAPRGVIDAYRKFMLSASADSRVAPV